MGKGRIIANAMAAIVVAKLITVTEQSRSTPCATGNPSRVQHGSE
jgi:hypothetical protein